MSNPKPISKSLLERTETSTGGGGYETRTTFAEGYSRRSTFSRAFTFDAEALGQSMAQPFSGLTRTLTQVGQRFDPDAQFTKAVIQEYVKHAESGHEGDVPLPPGFARKFEFWKIIFLSGLVACFMGIVAAGFMNLVDKVPKTWDDCDYTNDASCGDWYNGKLYWIAITACTGFGVGLIRWAFEYPDNLPGIFVEITNCHVDPKWSPLTFIISGMSLAGGATLGPEQALGNVGGGLATWVSEHVEFEDEDYKKVFVLSGMAAALGALFPTPMLGSLMIHELGNPPKTFMESTMILSVSAVLGFTVYYELVEVSYLEPVTSNGIQISNAWLTDPGYQNWQVTTGFAIGVVSAALCIMVIITIGICKQIFSRLRMRLAHNRFLQQILPPTIGGVLIGTVNWALPATVGNGNMIFAWILKYGAMEKVVSEKLLICTAFARMFLLGVSMNCGYIGGIIFPFLTMGMIAGTVCYLHYPYLPLGLCVGCFMVSVPCGIVPMPFTFTCLSAFLFFFGLYQIVPIFIATFTSYLIVCGSGLFKKLSSRANAQPNPEGQADVESDEKAGEIAKQEADDFALKQYLGSKKNATQEARNAAPVSGQQ